MAADTQMKCPMCLEEVNVGAAKCRHCHTILNKNFFSPSHPNFKVSIVSGSMLAILFFTFCFFAINDSKQRIGKSFADANFNNDLKIESHKLLSTERAEVIGEVKNTGNKHWYSTNIKVNFYDGSNSLVNVRSTTIYYIVPNEKRTFKIKDCCGEKNDRPFKFDRYEIHLEEQVINRW